MASNFGAVLAINVDPPATRAGGTKDAVCQRFNLHRRA